MKHLLLVVVTAVAAATFIPMAGADTPFQSLTGSGWRGTIANPNTPKTHFAVSARTGSGGVSGAYISMNPSNPLFNYAGDVTCLDVVGNQAIVGGVVTSRGEPGQVGTGFATGFIDNGGQPDSMTFSDLEIATPADCAGESFLFTLMLFPVLQGNVVVG